MSENGFAGFNPQPTLNHLSLQPESIETPESDLPSQTNGVNTTKGG